MKELQELLDWKIKFGITVIGETIEEIENTISLNLSNYDITYLPDSFILFKNLEYLNLSNNNLSEFPEIIYYLNYLTSLNLSSNQIQNIRLEYTNIKQLFLENNLIKTFSIHPKIFHLNILNLNNNYLIDLDDNIMNNLELEKLDVRHNCITKFNFNFLLLNIKNIFISQKHYISLSFVLNYTNLEDKNIIIEKYIENLNKGLRVDLKFNYIKNNVLYRKNYQNNINITYSKENNFI